MILHNAFLNRFYSFATFIESYTFDKILPIHRESTNTKSYRLKLRRRRYGILNKRELD